MNYYAHYDRKTGYFQKLEDHLENVAKGARLNVPPTVSFDILSNDDVKELSDLSGKFHDLGKFTTFFQDYLLNEKSSHLKHHAHISAIALYRFLQLDRSDLLSSFNQREDQAIIFLTYLVVRLHHQNLSLDNLFSSSNAMSMWKELAEQADDLLLKFDELERIFGFSKEQIHYMFQINEVRNDRQLTRFRTRFGTRLKHDRWYFMLLYLFSLLIDSDKLDSAEIGRRHLNDLPSERVPQYIAEKHSGDKVNDLVRRRDRARNTIIRTIKNMNDDELHRHRIFTLTAPTGIGKTLASLQATLILRERLGSIYGYKPRIITAIPFINIINQTNDDYQAVVGQDGHIIVHHRLADISINSEDKEESVPLDKAFMEVESWEGDVILTTFVQLFQSVFTGQNRRLKKYNKLAGSIVMLDEIQSIPEKYMPLIGACLIKLSEYYGTRFVLMTATQPKILELGQLLLKESGATSTFKKSVELLPDHSDYFNQLTRTKIVPCLNESMDTHEFVSFFEKTWGKRSCLIVVNTIKRSLKLYDKLKRNYSSEATVLYLSTNITPKHRATVIKKVKDLLKKEKPVILVSTQTIEAGVDLDFEVGYRALAPLESIIQTAGRINRKGAYIDEQGKLITSPVYVMELEVDHQFVYQLHHLERTKNLLIDRKEIAENDYQGLVTEYYDSMLTAPDLKLSKEIWEDGIQLLDFGIVEKFQLIESPGEIVDVYVEMDNWATSLADAYEEVRHNKNQYDLTVFRDIVDYSFLKDLKTELSPFERKSLLQVVTAKMNEYMVQIRLKTYVKNRAIEFSARNGVGSDMFWIPPDQIDDFYSLETGYLDDSGKAFVF